MAETIRVEGLDQLVRSLGRIDRGLRRELQKELKKAAVPVILDYRATAPKKTGKMTASAKPSVRGGSVYVRVTATKSSPKYPSYKYPNRVEYGSGSSHPLHTSFSRQRAAALHTLEGVVDWVADEFGKGV